MDKIAINPNRLQWCMNTLDIDIAYLSSQVHFAQETLEQAMASKVVLSINQLEKIANYFKRSLLFFLDSNEIQEDKIYSPQFRTINNQKQVHSPKLRAFIERVERQRLVYLGLLEDLGEPVQQDWRHQLDWRGKDAKEISASVRQWLSFPNKYIFDDLRQAVEKKGIMVIVSNGYNGKWQIDKNNPVLGFFLYYEILPIIVIKKQASKGAQAFTLMHELAHLLLHKESAIDDKEDFDRYQGKEKQANEFAGNVLMPDNFINKINVSELLNLDVTAYDDYLTDFKNLWCVSVKAILVRLLRNNKINQQHYQNYKKHKDAQIKKVRRRKSEKIPRTYRHREPVNMCKYSVNPVMSKYEKKGEDFFANY